MGTKYIRAGKQLKIKVQNPLNLTPKILQAFRKVLQTGEKTLKHPVAIRVDVQCPWPLGLVRPQRRE